MISLMLHEVRVRRRMILGWTIGLASFGVMYMSFFPAMPDEMLNLDIESIDFYKGMGVQSMATFEGYMQSTVFNFLPLLMGAFGIVLGAGALAGEEDAGTLELLATLPISRLQLYLAKAVAVVLVALTVALAVAVIVAAVFPAIESQIDTSVTVLDLFWAMFSFWLIGFVFASLGLFLGALLPSRGSTLAVASAVLVVTFFGNTLAAMVEVLERVQPLFPFSYFVRITESITGDVPWDDVLILLVMGIVPFALGALGFQRRDLTVGAWPWQRPRPGEASEGDLRQTIRSRRVVVPLAVLALAACGCVAVSAMAMLASDDLRADVEERLGIDGENVVTGSGELADGEVTAVAAAPGQVVYVPASVGDDVDTGDDLVVLAGAGASALVVEAQRVMEGAWTLFDELATGESSDSVENLQAAAERADVAAGAAVRGWHQARAAGEAGDAVDDLETRAELAWTAQHIAEARLALAEDRLSDADMQLIEAGMTRAQAELRGAEAGPALQSVRAPAAGTVSAILVRSGDVVSEGQTVVRLTNPESVEIVIRVSEDDADRIEVGLSAEVEVDDFDDPFEGEVVAVFEVEADGADDDAGDDKGDEDSDDLPFAVRIAVADATGELEPGLEAEVRIDLE